ncbi:DMT family transporter [Massilia endophytica]|uniref:DMT family transporter n=1 Tax=Massilia endophytica TaxID=2899220 RepID=UPI001E596E5E|nr:EamA family transporter [Massilia endophytica]UGQ44737.1 EamA family transporter [Massilia endophytica]
MKRSDMMQLVLVAAIWGASYLFIRVAAPAFGPWAMAGLRAVLASLMLLPLVLWRGLLPDLRRYWKGVALVGVTNAALPFLLFNYAALHISAGLSSILSSTTPLFAALIAALWLGESLGRQRIVGLAIGFGGVFMLVAGKLHMQSDAFATLMAALACLCATLLYGFTGNFTKRYLSGAQPMTIAAGSQFFAAVLLAPGTVIGWPSDAPSWQGWGALLALAALCTTFAYVLFYGLITRLGASRAMSALFLIPAFGVLWGTLFLHEEFTLRMGVSCVVILCGCALTTGVVSLPQFVRRPMQKPL